MFQNEHIFFEQKNTFYFRNDLDRIIEFESGLEDHPIFFSKVTSNEPSYTLKVLTAPESTKKVGNKDSKAVEIAGQNYSVEELIISRFKRQTMVVSASRTMIQSQSMSKRKSNIPRNVIESSFSLSMRQISRKPIDTFKHKPQMMRNSNEKEGLLFNLLENFIQGEDIFMKNSGSQVTEIRSEQSPNDSKGQQEDLYSSKKIKIISFEKEPSSALNESVSNHESSSSIPGLTSFTPLGGRQRFLMLDDSSRVKQDKKDLAEFLRILTPVIIKMAGLISLDTELVNFYKTGYKHQFIIEDDIEEVITRRFREKIIKSMCLSSLISETHKHMKVFLFSTKEYPDKLK